VRIVFVFAVLPEFFESMKRTSTTVVNACRNVILRLSGKLEPGLEELGVRAPLFVMQSK